MSDRLPSIGVVTTSTNSLSRNYPALLACVDSWGRWADQIVIVDGGTTDNTYSALKDWTDVRNYEIYSRPETHWDTHGCFHAAQWTINTLAGLERLQTDWAVIVPADHILDLKTAGRIRRELTRYNDHLGGWFVRKRFRDNGRRIEKDTKWHILNLKKIRAGNVPLGWDWDRAVNRLTDYPLIVDHHTAFTDPADGVIKKHRAGLAMPLTFTVPLECWAYGFYFFSSEQALNHLRQFHSVFSVRYSKQAPKSDPWHLQRAQIDGIRTYLNKKQELRKPHIPEARRLVDHFYRPDMIGSAITAPYRDYPGKVFLKRAADKIATLRFGMTGFKSIRDVQIWRPVTEDLPDPLDMRALYSEQDRYLPTASRIDWTKVEQENVTRTCQAAV